MSRHARAVFAASILPWVAVAQQPAPPSAPAQTSVSIRVVEGDGAINSIKLHRAHDPVVQVVDPTGAPVAGATVTFLLPASGPSGTFAGSGLSVTMQTGPDGRATGRGLKPNLLPGQYRMRVTASSRGQAASATITQTNAEPVAKSKSSRTIVILAIVGVAAAGGAAAALHGGGSSNSTAAIAGGASGGSSSGAVIVPGAPGFGPPH
jgi:hypothetical protein